MLENDENESNYYCECCHCKKVFMLLVVLILAFMAGIMVGCCKSQTYPAEIYHYNHAMSPAHQPIPGKKFHRGAQQIPANGNPTAPGAANGVPLGGFIIETD